MTPAYELCEDDAGWIRVCGRGEDGELTPVPDAPLFTHVDAAQHWIDTHAST